MKVSYATLDAITKTGEPLKGITAAWRVEGETEFYRGMSTPIYFTNEKDYVTRRLHHVGGKMVVQELKAEQRRCNTVVILPYAWCNIDLREN